jgi:mRNA interferase MazF
MPGSKLSPVKTPHSFQRGEVYWVSFDSSVGSEIKKRRPSIIVSSDLANRFLSRLQVVPLTSNTEHLYPSEALVTVKGQKSKAMADQIQTVSIERIGDQLGRLTEEGMRDVERVLKIQLGLSYSNKT